MNLPKAFICDTNVLIFDPSAVETLMNDVNVLFLHTLVMQELDNLKSRQDIGRDCREVIRKIEQLHKDNNPRLKIIQKSDWSSDKLSHLDQNKNDHHIIALAHNLQNNPNYKEVKLISKDIVVRVLARDLGIITDDYISESVEVDNTSLKEIEVPYTIIDKLYDGYVFTLDNMDDFIENEGVICWSSWNGSFFPQPNSEWRQQFTAIKKGNKFHIIDSNISVMGLSPYTMNNIGKNWEQHIAMAQLLDDSIKCVFLMGGAGSGKTMLALASALEQRGKFRNILVTRPMVSLSDIDRVGFLPGGLEEKIEPFLKPIYRTISQIGSISEINRKIIEKVNENNKIEILSLGTIRGLTFVKDVVICDEMQNTTQNEMRTLITRAGEGTKMIFTGDLDQVDIQKLVSRETNGLAYASSKMSNQKMVSSINFKKTVRSELACLAEKLLK